jgi:DNA modification methylase
MNKIEFGDCRTTMRKWAAAGIKAQTCVTSPPYYGLRDYGHDGQIGLEETPEEYIAAMVEVFRCVWDVLEDDGTLWLNIGDSYAMASMRGKNSKFSGNVGAHSGYEKGSVKLGKKSIPVGLKAKDLIGIPWMLAFALRADGWYLRQDIIWHKPNPMPESVKDRCTKSHEYIFLLSKSNKYYFDNESIREKGKMTAQDSAGSTQQDTRLTHGLGGGNSGINKAKQKLAEELQTLGYSTRNKRDVWTVAVKPYSGAHFATFPPDLITPCILAGTPVGRIVLDPFMGSGTTAAVAVLNGRNYLGCELNPAYKELQDARIGTPKPTDLFGCQYA